MGNEVSTPHEGPPELLEERDIPSIAKYIKSEQCRKVFVMLGAGVSTAAGIPDFRSPGTGLYSNLQRFDLPYPEAVFEINYFRENPSPFYILCRELYPGRYRPTLTHTFVKLLADHSLLDTCFTQNIDTLERQAGVPGHRVVEAHGSFADQHCIDCRSRHDPAQMKAAVERGDIVRCDHCGGLVKPDVVFFGEALPERFHMTVPKLREADLLIVIGTSLKVHPFASLTGLVPESCPRVLINMEPAGDIGTRADDVTLLGRCDEVIQNLARELGWDEELQREWEKTEALVPLEPREDPVAEKPTEVEETKGPDAVGDSIPSPLTKKEVEDARVDADVDTLAEQVSKALEISEGDRNEEKNGDTEDALVQPPVAIENVSATERNHSTPPGPSPEQPVESTKDIPKEKEKL